MPRLTGGSLGEVAISSGSLLIADPMFANEPVQIDRIPPGRVPVEAVIIEYPQGGRHIKKIVLRFRPGPGDSRAAPGSLIVDSACVVLLDAATYARFWQEVGPERIGITSTPTEHRRVAELIRKQFGLKHREISILHSRFVEPISEEMESRIIAFLKTFPEFAEFTFMYFRVQTGNTLSKLQKAMSNRHWCEIVLDEPSGANLVAVTSGFGDGTYTVEALSQSQELLGVEVEFIGPAQDRVLESFPYLKYPGSEIAASETSIYDDRSPAAKMRAWRVEAGRVSPPVSNWRDAESRPS